MIDKPRGHHCASGQASILGLGLAVGAAALLIVLVAVITWYGAQSRLQRAADIAAAGLSVPSGDEPVAHARALARANGARELQVSTRGDGRHEVVVRAAAPSIIGLSSGGDLIARAVVPGPTTGVVNAGGVPAGTASGGGYAGPLVQVDAARVCPQVATSYRSMQQAAAVSGVGLTAVSGFRSDAEQAILYAQLGPGIAAPPGTSLHRNATELDISTGPTGSPVHRWLTINAGRFGFIQRYPWEPWHWGNVRGC